MYLESEDNYKKQQEAVKKEIKSIGNKSKALKSMKKELTMKENPEVKKKCRLVRMIIDESLEMYESGEMKYEEMIEDINKSLKGIS